MQNLTYLFLFGRATTPGFQTVMGHMLTVTNFIQHLSCYLNSQTKLFSKYIGRRQE